MPSRSKVITMLPACIRQEVERRLFENGFRDYEGLAQWVRGQGYEISDDSLWRYGRALQQQLAAAELTVRHARALAKLGADHKGLTAKTLITVAQQKALESLLEMEEVKPADLNAVANLTRAAIAQQRWDAKLKARNEQPKPAAGKPETKTQNEPEPTAPNAQPATVPLQRSATASAMTVNAERSSPPARNRGDHCDQPSREVSTPAGGGAPVTPDKAPAAIVTAALRGSPRIAETIIPFANYDWSAGYLRRVAGCSARAEMRAIDPALLVSAPQAALGLCAS